MISEESSGTDPRLLGALRKNVSTGGFRVVMNETHLTRNSVSSAACYAFNSLYLSRARDFTTFTLHDLTDFT